MIGIDIAEIERIGKLYKKYGDRFLNRVFNKDEIKYLERKAFKSETIAGMYTAKEAIAKANETGIGKISFKDIKIYYKNGSPYGKLFNKNYKLSISHDGGFAICVSILNKRSDNIFNRRKADSHKGDYGKVGIFAGSRGMTGSAYLSSLAALRMGSGLVYNYVPENIFDIMSIKHTEVIVKSNVGLDLKLLNELDSIALGMGIGKSRESKKLLEEILNLEKNVIIDADGLNILSENKDLLKRRKPFTTVLTPHLMEFSRLTGLNIEDIKKNSKKISKEFSKKYKVVLLLKGNKTIVTYGDKFYINNSGNPGMATAGSGDVLSGIIASLLGRGKNIFEATCLGAYVHGLCGDLASKSLGQESMIASDIIKYMPDVTKNIDLGDMSIYNIYTH
ncbi:MAG: NAD(P)H-hydrate dehydratase [Peptoniphilaceae bacterium]